MLFDAVVWDTRWGGGDSFTGRASLHFRRKGKGNKLDKMLLFSPYYVRRQRLILQGVARRRRDGFLPKETVKKIDKRG